MATNMTDTDALRYSSFTTDENLTPDDFILYKDIDKDHKDMIKRYYTLKDKTFITDTEKLEMTQLLTNLEEYMITSDAFNKLCACVRTMQMFMRDGIVIFIDQQKSELIELMQSYKKVGVWNNEISYKIGNVVTYNGYSFLSKRGNNLNNTPNVEATEDDYWLRLTIKGDKGDPSLNISIKKGTDGSANYDNTIVYNTGDACVYEHRLYYALVNGIIGITPTDNTKWACADKVVVDAKEPTDQYVVWWDTSSGNNTFKRYNNNTNIWTEQSIKGMNVSLIDNGNKFVNKNVEGALSQLATNSIPYAVTTGLTNNYSITLNPAPSFYFDGMPICVKINVSSTGASTINVNNLGAKAIKKANGNNVTNLIAGSIYTMRYNGTNFILQGEGGSGNAMPSDLRSGKIASTDNGDIVGTAPEQPSATYIVGTSDQIIASGKILSGNQIIKGYPDLIPQNVAEGKRIGNIVGELLVLDINKGGVLVGIPSLNIGEPMLDVIKIEDNNFYYVDKNYSIKYFDYKIRKISTVSNVSVLNPYSGSFIDSGVLKGVTKDYYIIGTLILDKNFNLIRNLAEINSNLKNFKYDVIIDPYDNLNNRIYIKIYFIYSGSGYQYNSESIISYDIDTNTSRSIASVGTGSGWGSVSTVFKNRVIVGNDVSDRDSDVHKIIYTARDIDTGDTITLKTDQWINGGHTEQNQLHTKYYTCTNSKRLIELAWSKEDTTGTNTHDNVIYMAYTVYNDYGNGYYSFRSPIYNDYGDAVEIGKLAKIVYNNNIETYIDKDMFTLRSATMKTSLGETYLAFSKNFIICSSGNLYLYN